MAEQFPENNETKTAPEIDYGNLEADERLEQKADESKDESKTEKIDIEAARELALEQPTEVPALPLDETPDGDKPQYIDRAMRALTLKNELSQIRQRLPASQRIFSKTIHQPAVRRTSEISAKTITRPYGLLGGGILAFLGSIVYLLFAKYIGIKYNYLLFILLFLIGYVLASIIEAIVKLFSKVQTKH